MMRVNSFKSITVLTDEFVFLSGKKHFLSPRGSNILLFDLIRTIKKKWGVDFEIYQLGIRDYQIDYMGISVNILNSKSFNDYKARLKQMSFKTDIIHYNNIDIFHERPMGIPVTATIHTNAFIENFKARKWLKKTANMIDGLVVVNTEYVKHFQSVRLIKNAISRDIFKYDSSRKRSLSHIDILFPNLNTPKKNRDFAIRLIKKLNGSSKYQFRLILTGEKERLPLKKEEYKFVGRKIRRRDMNMLYRKCFITIIPSFSESCSLCALESMSSGTPVIANSIYGISDYIQNNQNGYLVSVDNIEAWIDKVLTLVEDASEYSRIQGNGRNSVIKEYNIGRMSKEYYLMWLSIFNEKEG